MAPTLNPLLFTSYVNNSKLNIQRKTIKYIVELLKLLESINIHDAALEDHYHQIKQSLIDVGQIVKSIAIDEAFLTYCSGMICGFKMILYETGIKGLLSDENQKVFESKHYELNLDLEQLQKYPKKLNNLAIY